MFSLFVVPNLFKRMKNDPKKVNKSQWESNQSDSFRRFCELELTRKKDSFMNQTKKKNFFWKRLSVKKKIIILSLFFGVPSQYIKFRRMSDFKQDMLNKSVKPIKVENNSITGQMNHSHTTKLLLMGCSFQIKRKHRFPLLKGFVQN